MKPSIVPRKSLRVLAVLAYATLLTCVFLLGAEYICRRRGISPWKVGPFGVTVTPGGKFFKKHDTLGYTHLPGRFVVRLSDVYSFIVTHGEDTLRITGDPEKQTFPAGQSIWIFGCSFTHGWSLNDQETYPWKLQEKLPHHEIVNFGVSGYGTIHALLQFQEMLAKNPPPKIAVIAYASFHDERNTFLRMRRKAVAPWNKLGPLVQPYGRLQGGNLKIFQADVEYEPFPLMQHSAFAHFLEQEYNKKEDRYHQSHKVTEAIVMEFAKVAREHGVQLVVAGITADETTRDTLKFARAKNLVAGDISVDLSVSENINLPHNSHPSARANEHYAQRLLGLLADNGLLSPEAL